MRLPHPRQNCIKAFRSCAQVLQDFFGEEIWFRRVYFPQKISTASAERDIGKKGGKRKFAAPSTYDRLSASRIALDPQRAALGPHRTGAPFVS